MNDLESQTENRNIDYRLRAFIAALLTLSTVSARAQDYGSSVVGADFDFITKEDASTFTDLVFIRRGQEEMPDKRRPSAKLNQPAYVFRAAFRDMAKVEIVVARKLGSQTAAKAEAMRYVQPLGKLPTALRRGVKRLVVHQGGRETTAFSDVGLIVIYAENATRRIATHDLEETIFHESVHAAWDKTHAQSDGWRQAQKMDGKFATRYAQRNPQLEDLAESALFAFALLHHPNRIPDGERQKLSKSIPNRIAYIAKLLPPDQPIHASTEAAKKAGWNDRSADIRCDIRLPGVLADVLSNCLSQKFGIEEKRVVTFASNAADRYADSEQLFRSAIQEFDLKTAELKSGLIEFLHVNCKHVSFDDEPAKRFIKSWSR